MLDQWAARVKFETERHLYRTHDPKWAKYYRNSEAYRRASFLLQVLQEDLGVKYDMTARDNFAFNDSRVAFIHGMIPAPGRTVADTSGGTCTYMPVMYVAVGRRGLTTTSTAGSWELAVGSWVGFAWRRELLHSSKQRQASSPAAASSQDNHSKNQNHPISPEPFGTRRQIFAIRCWPSLWPFYVFVLRFDLIRDLGISLL